MVRGSPRKGKAGREGEGRRGGEEEGENKSGEGEGEERGFGGGREGGKDLDSLQVVGDAAQGLQHSVGAHILLHRVPQELLKS
jgi:hypothetical protein